MASSLAQRELGEIFRTDLLPWARSGSLQPYVAGVSGPVPCDPGLVFRQEVLLSAAEPPIVFNEEAYFLNLGMDFRRYPCMVCVLDGEVDMCICPVHRNGPGKKKLLKKSAAQIFTLPSRACLVIPPDLPYSDSSSGYWKQPFSEGSSARLLWFVFQPMGVAIHVCHRKGESYSYTPLLFAQDPRLLTLTQLIIETAESWPVEAPDEASELLISLFLPLLLCIREGLSHSRLIAGSGKPGRINQEEKNPESYRAAETKSAALERVCLYIRSHLREPLTLAEIARHTYIAAPQLNRLFRAHIGVSVMKYVTQCRMEEAKSLLAITSLTVQEVGGIYGYRNRTHFSTAFTRWAGVSPRIFRASLRSTDVEA